MIKSIKTFNILRIIQLGGGDDGKNSGKFCDDTFINICAQVVVQSEEKYFLMKIKKNKMM